MELLRNQLRSFFGHPASRSVEIQPFPWKHGLTVEIVRQPRARRYLLRLTTDGAPRLVIPRHGSQSEALRFLDRSEPWLLRRLAQRRARVTAPLSWTDGARFLFRGDEVALRVEERAGQVRLAFADQVVVLPQPSGDYRGAVLSHLRRLAERELPPRTFELARVHSVAVHRVTVRAQKSRWGSCSARGTISLNWRIIQAPPHVSDYLIIHELMHRREMNHSAAYWKHVADACPGYRVAEQWLKKTRFERMG